MKKISQKRVDLYDEIASTIGNTPIIEIKQSKLNGYRNRLFMKNESENPSGSHYDRVFLKLYFHYESLGKITPGKTTILENTSGSAGRSCAFLGKLLGYETEIIVPPNLPSKRIEGIKNYTENVIISTSDEYVNGTTRELKKLLINKEKNYFCLNHSRQQLSVDAINQCALEIVAHMNKQGLTVHHFHGAAGNGITLDGIGSVLKNSFGTRITAVDPLEAPVASSLKYQNNPDFRQHELFGMGAWGIEFPFLKPSKYDETVMIDEYQWKKAQRTIEVFEGLKVGNSSAACFAASNLKAQQEKDNIFLTILYDSAKFY